jgi:hypothetical protein
MMSYHIIHNVMNGRVHVPELQSTITDPGIDGRIILGGIFRKWYVGAWTGLSRLRIGTGGGQL